MWALEITGDIQSDAPVPKANFRYVGNVHGDEPLGRQLLPALGEERRHQQEHTGLLASCHCYLHVPQPFGYPPRCPQPNSSAEEPMTMTISTCAMTWLLCSAGSGSSWSRR